ncbi:hypothetical protein [Phenylobacterium soli]|uniref:Lipoprotein n=1 Tax=Phenylobacterium soli TaxID=2170551 RepID=A0A328ACG6_9CAUL|nr:hypothetical protein [Phenylobacterium soli]RAK51896.1 hypothetical protein DJ017_18965 [Phenylobacterium soli]
MKTLARFVLGLASLGGAATLAACADEYAYAPPPPPPAPVGYAAPAVAVVPACFFTRDIRNHTIGDDRTLYLNVNDRMVYRVEMEGGCLAGATSSDPIVIQNPPGSNNVCRPIDLDIGVHMGGGGGFTNRCIVRNIVPLSPAEVAALPPKLRP